MGEQDSRPGREPGTDTADAAESAEARSVETESAKAAKAKANRARLVFGDPLDRQSSDDTDRGWGERSGGESRRGLDWYLSQRPPHHGE
ncbi:hypothetical protein [Kitasatospora camelliae]|uniref:Uncharacterized protein n=1 Tax=Kitasatospora camelliae TaxID=3156397 RepID=A0AAU8JXF4_9ACTN